MKKIWKKDKIYIISNNILIIYIRRVNNNETNNFIYWSMGGSYI